MKLFEDHNKRAKKLIGKDYAPATVCRYNTSYKHTVAYLKHQYNRTDISFDEINHSFIENYEAFLKTELECSHNTAIKYLRNFKRIFRIAMANGWINHDPFINYKLSTKPTNRVYLTEEELKLIIEKKIDIPRLDTIRDTFLFSCFTGLAYSDIKALSYNDIKRDLKDKPWIDRGRKKTDIDFQVPLMDIALKLLNKYKDHPVCVRKGLAFPVLTNQNYNAYLKELADICGIPKKLTTHAARHTFATTVTLMNGVPMEAVSKMLGHTNLHTTKIYAQITQKFVKNSMEGIMELYA